LPFRENRNLGNFPVERGASRVSNGTQMEVFVLNFIVFCEVKLLGWDISEKNP
jgi:hypothetical protein